MHSPKRDSQGSTRTQRARSNWMRAFQAIGLGEAADRQGSTASTANTANEPATIQKNLQQAMEDKWHTRYYSRYREVNVLLMHWADADDAALGSDKAANSLADIFQRLGFDVQFWLIPTVEHPQRFVISTLTKFVRDYGHEGNLLIFWYGGSAKETDSGKGPVMWFGDRWGGEVNSTIVPQILGSSSADVLTLYDCGFSIHGQIATRARVFEHLGASAGGIVEGFRRPGSFTRCLIRILDRPEAAAYGVSVPDIHRKLVNFAKRGRAAAAAAAATDPTEEEERDDASVYTSGGRGRAVSTASAVPSLWLSGVVGPSPPSPVYCRLSAGRPRSKGEPATIVLSRLGYPLEVFPNENPPEEEQEVELCIRLKRNDINVERWTQWLLDAPPEADRVTVKKAPQMI